MELLFFKMGKSLGRIGMGGTGKSEFWIWYEVFIRHPGRGGE